LRVAVGSEQMAFVKFPDTQSDQVDFFQRRLRIAITTHYPNDVVEVLIAFSEVATVGKALLRFELQDLLNPSLVSANITQVDGRQEHLHTVFTSLSDDPIGMSKILLIGSGEITRRSEGGVPRLVQGRVLAEAV